MKEIEKNKIEGSPFIKDSQTTTADPSTRVLSIFDDLCDQKKSGDKTGWGSKIFNFLKILIFGACVFFYDITSKYCH